jgi:tetratricopeptide (TPR) repeat protein
MRVEGVATRAGFQTHRLALLSRAPYRVVGFSTGEGAISPRPLLAGDAWITDSRFALPAPAAPAKRLIHVELPPVDAMSQKAIRLWQQQRFDEALREFRLAATKSRNAVAWIDYANGLALSWQGRRAVEAFERAWRIGPQGAVDKAAADRFLALGRFDLAAGFLERIRHRGDAESRHALGLAECLERAGKIEASAESLDAALGRFGPLPELRIFKSKLLRRLGIPDESLALLDAVIADGRLEGRPASSVHYERAACLEKLGRYREVFPALQEAKQPLLALHQDMLEHSTQTLHRLRDDVSKLTREQVRAWRERPAGKPLCLMTGFPRSGTTLLEVILDSHERVITSSEAPIFSDFVLTPECDPNDGSFPAPFDGPKAKALAARYWNYQEGNLGEPGRRLIVDKNPALTPILHHFINVFGSSQLLFCLREPKDVMISCYQQDLPIGRTSVHFLEWRACWEFYRISMEIWLRLRELLDGDFLEVRYEDLVRDHTGTMRGVLDHLGLEWSGRIPGYLEREDGTQVFSPTYADVRAPIHGSAVQRWTRHEQHFGDAADVPFEHPLFRDLGY